MYYHELHKLFLRTLQQMPPFNRCQDRAVCNNLLCLFTIIIVYYYNIIIHTWSGGAGTTNTGSLMPRDGISSQ